MEDGAVSRPVAPTVDRAAVEKARLARLKHVEEYGRSASDIPPNMTASIDHVTGKRKFEPVVDYEGNMRRAIAWGQEEWRLKNIEECARQSTVPVLGEVAKAREKHREFESLLSTRLENGMYAGITYLEMQVFMEEFKKDRGMTETSDEYRVRMTGTDQGEPALWSALEKLEQDYLLACRLMRMKERGYTVTELQDKALDRFSKGTGVPIVDPRVARRVVLEEATKRMFQQAGYSCQEEALEQAGKLREKQLAQLARSEERAFLHRQEEDMMRRHEREVEREESVTT